MDGLRYAGTKAAIYGMAACNITQQGEIQTDYFNQENHMYLPCFGIGNEYRLSPFPSY